MTATDSIQGAKQFFEHDSVIDAGSVAGKFVGDNFNHYEEALQQFPLIKLSILSLAICLITIVTIVILYIVLGARVDKKKQPKEKSRIIKAINKISLKCVFIAAWCCNFVVYDIGMSTSNLISLLTNAPMAILHAFGAFVLDSDVSEIQNTFHESWLFMMGFSLSHMFAAIVSTLFLLKHFGFNILEKVELKILSKRKQMIDDTYVFFGIDDASCNLIKSIQKKYKDNSEVDKDRKNRLGSYEIIAVRTNKDDDDEPENRTGIWRIFDFLSIKTSELDKLKDLHCYTACTYAELSKLSIPEEGKTMDVFGSLLKLKDLKKILKEKTKNNIHIFFLSDDENENIHSTLLLLKDETLNAFSTKYVDGTDIIDEPEVDVTRDNKSASSEASNTTTTATEKAEETEGKDTDNKDSETHKKRHVLYYCHARYNSIHRVIEDQHRSDNEIVKIVDSSHINVEMLKQDPKLLPVNYVEVEKDAKVATDFHALVVGFSEVGQDSVKFLYEFGAFVAYGSDNEKPRRSGFRLDVVDKNMSDLAGTFVCNAPAIGPRLTFLEEGEKPIELNKSKRNDDNNPEKKDLIVLHEMDCRSVRFYKKLEDWIKTLNYIVIATEDDELNLSLGVRIFKIATRYRKDLDKFCVIVRVHEDSDGHAFRIIDHYNHLWAAELADEEKKLCQRTFRKNYKVNGPLYLFGLDRRTYTYDNIIDDTHEKKAVEYKERYAKATEDKYSEPKNEEDKMWYKEIRKRLQLDDVLIINGKDRYYYSPTFSSLMKLRRTLGQDMANSLHALTKRILIEKALCKLDKDNFDWSIVSRSTKDVKYKFKGEEDKEIQLILLVIAQTEHLRWNASHEILGYIHKHENIEYKDEMRLHHGCLTDWDKLNDEKRSYDFNVVDLTLDDIKGK